MECTGLLHSAVAWKIIVCSILLCSFISIAIIEECDETPQIGHSMCYGGGIRKIYIVAGLSFPLKTRFL